MSDKPAPAQYETPEWHPAAEEYCETIFELREDDINVIQARIADRLDVSRPAVSEMIHRLVADGLVELSGRKIDLTEAGKALAEKVVRRHRLAERLLTDVLGLSWSVAHTEAGKWEHVISDVVEDALVNLLDDPTTCPHGNPIPGSGYDAPETLSLSELAQGEEFKVVRIPEELEFTPGMLDYLEGNNLVPGQRGAISMLSPDGTVTVSLDDTSVGVGQFAAERILVTR